VHHFLLLVIDEGEGVEMDMAPSGSGRFVVALVVLALLALLVWRTMEPGRLQQVTWLLLAFFAFRVVLTRLRAR
jgi:hypothetical protein